MKKILIGIVLVVIGGIVLYFLAQNSKERGSDVTKQALANSVRRLVNVGLETYYDQNKRLPKNLSEYLAFNPSLNTSTNNSVSTLISYKLIDEKNVELCYLVKVDASRGPNCITYTQK